LNQNKPDLGIQNDSIWSQTALADAMLDNVALKDLLGKKW
jgi:hypothetical protein